MIKVFGIYDYWIAAASDGRSALPLCHTMYKAQYESSPAVYLGWQDSIKSNPFGLSIIWQSAKEQSIKEFNILRANIKKGIYKKINSAPILPERASSYKYLDSTAVKGINYFYKLEVLGKNKGELKLFVSISGRKTVR